MLKKTIKYTDFDGNEREEDFFFNLSKAEITEMEMGVSGGMSEMLKRIVAANDTKQIIGIFKSIIEKTYGQKSPDGKRFIKGKELWEEFSQTDAYSELFMELTSDADAATAFFNSVNPKIPKGQQG